VEVGTHVFDNDFTKLLKKVFIDNCADDKMLLYVHRVLFKLFPRQTLEDVFDSVFTKIPSGSSSSSTALTSTQRRLAMNGLMLDDRTASFRGHVNSIRPWKLEHV